MGIIEKGVVMTVREVATQLCEISTDGKFNGEKFTRRELADYIHNMFRGELKLGNRFVMSMVLKDGEWLFAVDRFADRADGYDYWIPDTREQEQELWEALYD